MALGSPEAVAAGAAWLLTRLTALLRVPSVNVLYYAVNALHANGSRIVVEGPVTLVWGPRLFGVLRSPAG